MAGRFLFFISEFINNHPNLQCSTPYYSIDLVHKHSFKNGQPSSNCLLPKTQGYAVARFEDTKKQIYIKSSSVLPKCKQTHYGLNSFKIKDKEGLSMLFF
jgi:hypothetical protein